MKEKLISFKTAKLAKEKGFTVPDTAFDYYRTKTKIGRCHRESQTGQYCLYHKCDFCIVVTQSLLQRWLREKHKLFVYCTPKGFVKGNSREIIRWGNNIGIRSNKYSSTYETALENGLIEALKLINKQLT